MPDDETSERPERSGNRDDDVNDPPTRRGVDAPRAPFDPEPPERRR